MAPLAAEKGGPCTPPPLGLDLTADVLQRLYFANAQELIPTPLSCLGRGAGGEG